MTDFDFDVKEKKNIARSAKNRVGKRKGCSLPSDHLTDAQKRRLNGEITSVNMNEPISWERFKLLSTDLQQEYVQHLIDTYGIGNTVISENLFGLGRSSLTMHLHTNGINVTGRKGPANALNIERFMKFCRGETEQPQEETATQETVEEAKNALMDAGWVAPAPAPKSEGTLSCWNFTFENVDDMREIVKLISNLPIPKKARVVISAYVPVNAP